MATFSPRAPAYSTVSNDWQVAVNHLYADIE